MSAVGGRAVCTRAYANNALLSPCAHGCHMIRWPEQREVENECMNHMLHVLVAEYGAGYQQHGVGHTRAHEGQHIHSNEM